VKDIQDILRQKEAECTRVQKEIDALRLVIPLLDEDSRPEIESKKQPEHAAEASTHAEGTGTDGPTFSSVGQSESSFWKRRR
jgi:hypothetical protein